MVGVFERHQIGKKNLIYLLSVICITGLGILYLSGFLYQFYPPLNESESLGYVVVIIDPSKDRYSTGDTVEVEFWLYNSNERNPIEITHYQTVDVNWYPVGEEPERAADIFLNLVPDAKLRINPKSKKYITDISFVPAEKGDYVVEILLEGEGLSLYKHSIIQIE